MIKEYIRKIIVKLILAERSSEKLTLSFCLGVYLSFSPFLGLQTWLVFPLCWLSGLNITVTMTTLYVVNNPLTTIPIILGGYFLGEWLLIKVLHIDAVAYNPVWLTKLVDFLARYVIDLKKHLGVDICFWCYFIGANVLAIILAVLLYPVMKPVFSRLLRQFYGENP